MVALMSGTECVADFCPLATPGPRTRKGTRISSSYPVPFDGCLRCSVGGKKDKEKPPCLAQQWSVLAGALTGKISDQLTAETETIVSGIDDIAGGWKESHGQLVFDRLVGATTDSRVFQESGFLELREDGVDKLVDRLETADPLAVVVVKVVDVALIELWQLFDP